MALPAPWHARKRGVVREALSTLGAGNGINGASLRQRRQAPSRLPGLGRYEAVLSHALTMQRPSFPPQISPIYPVPDVLSQLPSPTWFMFVILSIKKLVIKMKPPLPILLPAFTLLHLPILRPLIVVKRLISMWSSLCQDSPVPSAPFFSPTRITVYHNQKSNTFSKHWF